MIRDPSDGSVKEISPNASEIKPVVAKSPAKGIGPDTGIRQPIRTDAQERLERSREWLKDYHARKDEAHARGNFGGEEHQAAGRSGDGQGEAEPGVSGEHGSDR